MVSSVPCPHPTEQATEMHSVPYWFRTGLPSTARQEDCFWFMSKAVISELLQRNSRNNLLEWEGTEKFTPPKFFLWQLLEEKKPSLFSCFDIIKPHQNPSVKLDFFGATKFVSVKNEKYFWKRKKRSQEQKHLVQHVPSTCTSTPIYQNLKSPA